jgi:hypothetical protein
MTARTDFTPEEWITLRNVPHLVAASMMIAGNSGLGTFKESFATAQGLYAGLSSDNAVIRDLAAREEAMAGQQFIRSQVSFGQTHAEVYGKLRSLAMAELDKAVALLGAKGTPADVAAYKKWVSDIANRVANAAKEGAFLGLGGERVSEGETALLEELGSKLG